MKDGPKITLCLQPENKIVVINRPKTCHQLLAALDLEEDGALVIRNDELLTPDRHIWPNDLITVRLVSSRG